MGDTPLRLAALIPAAGLSSRMHGYKPLLPLGDSVMIREVIRLFQMSGVGDIVVVTGHNHERLAPVAEEAGARVVFNPDFREGMFSSIRAGAKALSADGFFLMPGDIPAVRTTTVERVIRAFAEDPAATVVPEFDGETGHPPLIPGRVREEILNAGPDGCLRDILFGEGAAVRCLPVFDRGILMDADTRDGYEAVCKKFRHLNLPDRLECEGMIRAALADAPGIRAHLARVEQVAVSLARALGPFRPGLNTELIRAGARLHDIKRQEENHAARGGAWLRAQGFPEVAEIVARHMNLIRSGEELTETDIVFFADKLCRGDQLDFDYEKRFHNKAEAFSHVRESILERLETVRNIHARIEALTGRSVRDILG